MTNSVDVDEVLKKLASQSIKRGETVRATVRDLTLKALQRRELTLDQIKKVLEGITEGVNLGAVKRGINIEKALSDALAGMDDALRKVVQASTVALQKLAGEGKDYEDSNLRQALADLEKLEDEFLQSVTTAAESANEKIKAQWGGVLERARLSGTGTGTQVAAAVRDYAKRAQTAMRKQRETGVKVAHLLTQNFATLASGVLTGMSEGLGAEGNAPRRRSKASTGEKTAKIAKGATTKTAKRPLAKTVKRAKATAARKSTK